MSFGIFRRIERETAKSLLPRRPHSASHLLGCIAWITAPALTHRPSKRLALENKTCPASSSSTSSWLEKREQKNQARTNAQAMSSFLLLMLLTLKIFCENYFHLHLRLFESGRIFYYGFFFAKVSAPATFHLFFSQLWFFIYLAFLILTILFPYSRYRSSSPEDLKIFV